MIYAVNTPVLYSASALTSGMLGDHFSYTWTFDDDVTYTGKTFVKVWRDVGLHSVAITATDLTTMVIAQTTVTVTIVSD